MSSASEQWTQQAHYDLVTAQAMFDAGRYLYVLFCCQQAVEKMLKAIIAHKTMELPPRVHQLTRLAEVAGLTMTEKQTNFLRLLSNYYLQTRYPDEIVNLASQVKKENALSLLEQTQEIIRWLTSI
ncbi:MAG: HEPN domain-containing protein [Candidatus Omnitrophota bacterium]|jgi:HEPN domain-containing protein|nr:MAG: HEPN domain-containing protein [Candidatus Omnitrophota bacterium]